MLNISCRPINNFLSRSHLYRFYKEEFTMKHRLKYGRNKQSAWSRVHLKNGETVWIHVLKKEIVIKRSRSAHTETMLFKRSNLPEIGKKIQQIDQHISEIDTAFEISDPTLRVFTHLASLSKSAEGFALILNTIFCTDTAPSGISEELPEKRTKVIREFMAFAKDNYKFGEFRDVADLPFPKHVILDAITLELIGEKNYERQEELRRYALMLVDFQENVGPQPLSALGMDPARLHDEIRAHKDDLVVLVKKMSEHPDVKKYAALKKIAAEELDLIQNRIASRQKPCK